MFRWGRTLFLSFIAMLVCQNLPQALGDSFHDCLTPLLRTATRLDTPLVDSLKHYNRLAEQSIDSFSLARLNREFEKSMHSLQKIAPSVPKEDFLKWYQANAYTGAELAALKAENKTLGEALHAKTDAFSKTLNSKEFDQATHELKEQLAELRKICKEDLQCHTAGIEKVVTKNQSKLFNCLRHDKDTLQSIITGFAVSNAALLVGQATKDDPTVKNFPYELLLNNVLWTPVLGEIACKNKARAELSLAGKTLDEKPRGFLTTAKNAGRAYWDYMKWSPANEASYMMFHVGGEKLRGDYKEKTWSQHADEFVMYLKWDAQYAVPRSIFLLDPLYNKWLPKNAKPFLSKTLGQPTGTGSYIALDIGLRLTSGAFSSRLFQEYEKQGSFKFVFDRFNDQPAAPLVATKAKPTRPKKKSCDQLSQAYLACMKARMDASETLELDARSTRYQTSTFQSCVSQLDAYETQCGSFFSQ